MSARTRFCVQFSGFRPQSSKKTRLLFSDSTSDDVRDIWKLLYDVEPPADIELVAGCKYIIEQITNVIFVTIPTICVFFLLNLVSAIC